MKRVIALGGAVLWAAGAIPGKPDEAAPDPVVDVVGVQVVRPVGFGQGKVRGRQVGTRVLLRVSAPGRCFADILPAASPVSAFRDDKGTDLVPADGAGVDRGWEPDLQVCPDGSRCIVEVAAARAPATGARSIHVDAQVALRCGQGARKHRREELRLARGAKLTAGGADMEVHSVQEGEFGGGAVLAVVFVTKKNPEAIRKLAFLDEDGKEIPSRVLRRRKCGFSGASTHEIIFGLGKAVAAAGVEVTTFEKVETVKVPVNLTVGLGL